MAKLDRPAVDAVEAVILHIVDPPGANRKPAGEARGLVLSERELPAATEAATFAYFLDHVRNALADDEVRAARFRPPTAATPNPVPGLVSALLDGSRDLVDVSSDLARRLHGIMADLQRVSAGDLVVCVCRGRGGRSGWSRFAAVLKIDPAEGYPRVTREAGRKSYITAKLDEKVAVLPTTRQELQKAAFIRLPAGRGPGGYDLLLLDRQVHGAGQVSRFFAEEFLGAETVVLGEVPETDAVVDIVREIRNQARPGLEAGKLARHEERAEKLLGQERVTVDDVKDLFAGDYKRRAEAAWRERLPVEEVTLDRKRVEKLTRTKKFKGEGDLRVEASPHVWKQVLRQAIRVTDDPAGPYWRIVLHTREWVEVR